MTDAQIRLLRLLAEGPINIREAQRRLGTTAAGISKTRTLLREWGCIEQWELWIDPMIITTAGRAAISGER